MGKLTVSQNTTAPSAPAAGKSSLYPKSDGLWYYKNNAGAEVLLGSGGGGGGGGSGDMASATYDPGAVAADAFAMDNMAEGTIAKIFTDAERLKLAGIAAGAQANRGLATQTQAQAGTDNSTGMTPLRVAEAIAALGGGGGGSGGDVDGGFAASIFTASQLLDGGTA